MIKIDGASLTIKDIIDVSFNGQEVSLDEQNRERMQTTRDVLERLVDDGEIIYGVNTGFGKFAEIQISADEILELQKNIVLSHAAGVGPPLSEPIVRAAAEGKWTGLWLFRRTSYHR